MWWRLAKKEKHTGVMIALYPSKTDSKKIALKEIQAKEILTADDLHITMFYIGDYKDLKKEQEQLIDTILKNFTTSFSPMPIKIGGIGVFDSKEDNNTHAMYASINSPELVDFRTKLAEIFDMLKIEYAKNFSYTPHMTLAYIESETPLPIEIPELDTKMDTIKFKLGDYKTYTYHLK
jgi:2'-5' RNA ligase